ncbi:MAG TPA: hypothetical protein VGB22_00190 [candidate division Zixibacteria bacterium]|jgi:hypothetical protein
MGELQKELEYFESKKLELLEHFEHKYVLIKNTRMHGAFDSFQAAYERGIELFGNVPMLIKRVERDESVLTFPALTLGVLRANV